MSNVKVFYPTRILSSATTPDLIDWVNRNLESGHHELLLNFKNVLFMDSTGLATLVTAQKLVKKSGGRLALCAVGGQARMLFDMAGMENLFELYDSAEEFQSKIAQPL